MKHTVADLNKINSMTKYPSILTYHALGERGRLKEEVQVPFDCEAICTEKIDGVNSRIILLSDGIYIIGSREELLYAKGDLIGNPQLGIVEALKPIAERLVPSEVLTVYYLEVYGGNVTKASKQYTGNKFVGFRIFDIAVIPNQIELLKEPIEKIASWRDNGGQIFYSEHNLAVAAAELSVPLTPRFGIEKRLPTGLADTHDWLKNTIKLTQASLDSDAIGKPEGIVVRAFDRSRIAKLRFEDYERTMIQSK